jgi:hypothetical protein
MYVDAYLLDEQAAYIQRERDVAAARGRLVQRARHIDKRADTTVSIVERVTAAFRPAPRACPTC